MCQRRELTENNWISFWSAGKKKKKKTTTDACCLFGAPATGIIKAEKCLNPSKSSYGTQGPATGTEKTLHNKALSLSTHRNTATDGFWDDAMLIHTGTARI